MKLRVTGNDNPYLELDYSGYHKTSSSNCLIYVHKLCVEYNVPKIWMQHTEGGMHFQDETKMF